MAEFVLFFPRDVRRDVATINECTVIFFGGAAAFDAAGAKGIDVCPAVKRVGVKDVGGLVAAVAGDGFFLCFEDVGGERVGAVFELRQRSFEFGGDAQRAFGGEAVAVIPGKVFEADDVLPVMAVVAVKGGLLVLKGGLVAAKRFVNVGKGAVFLRAVRLGGKHGFEVKQPQQAGVFVKRVRFVDEGLIVVGVHGMSCGRNLHTP